MIFLDFTILHILGLRKYFLKFKFIYIFTAI